MSDDPSQHFRVGNVVGFFFLIWIPFILFWLAVTSPGMPPFLPFWTTFIVCGVGALFSEVTRCTFQTGPPPQQRPPYQPPAHRPVDEDGWIPTNQPPTNQPPSQPQGPYVPVDPRPEDR